MYLLSLPTKYLGMYFLVGMLCGLSPNPAIHPL